MKIKVIDNDIDKTLEQFGLTVYDELGELIDEDWEEDVEEIEFKPNFSFDQFELMDHGAEEFSTGDGWNEPIQYHLQGDANDITERILDKMLENSNTNDNATELLKFVKEEIRDAVSRELN